MGQWNILCDFDGTISVEDVTDSLLERFAHPDWLELERDWREGRIGSAQCMAGQIAWLDASPDDIDAHLATLRLDPAFPAFVDAVASAGMDLRVISDGLDYAIKAILHRYGLAHLPVQANHLVQTGPRSWKLETPFADADCRVKSGHCKCTSAMRVRDNGRPVLLIGDGASDFCTATEADFVFAKHRLIEHCRHADIPHVSIVGFADAVDLLPALLAGKLHTPRRASPALS